MANTIQLSQGGLDDLTKGLDKLVASMDKLERTMSRLEGKPTFARLFGSVDDFDKITKAISGLTYSGIKNFEALANSVKLLLLQMTELGNAKFSTRAVGQMFAAIAQIGEGKANIPNIHAVLAAMKDFITQGIGLAGKINPGVIQSFLRVGTAIGSIGSGFKALADLQKATGVATDINIRPFIKLVNEIAAIRFDGNFEGLRSISKMFKFFTDLATIDLKAMANSVGYLQVVLDQIAGLKLPRVVEFKVIADVLVQFGKGLQGVNASLQTAAVQRLLNVNGFASGLHQLGQLFATIDKEKGFWDNAGRLALSFLKNIVGMGVIVPALMLWTTIYTRVIGLITTLTKPFDVGIDAFVNNIRMMGNAFEAISKALAGGFKAKAGSDAWSTIGVFASNIIGTLGAVVKIGVVFPIITTVLVGVFKTLGLLARLVPGDEALTNITKSVQRIGQTFTNITQALGGNSMGSKLAPIDKTQEFISQFGTGLKNIIAVIWNIVKIGVVFPVLATGLVVVFKALSAIAALPFGNDALTKVTSSVKTVALAFVAINEAFGGKASGLGTGLLSAIGNILKVGVVFPLLATQLTVIFKALGLFSQIAPGNTAAVASTIKGFAEVISAVANNKIDYGAFKKAAAGFKVIGDAINGLTKSLVKKGQIEAFVGVGEAVSKVLGGMVGIDAAAKGISIVGLIKLRVIFASIGAAMQSAVAGLRGTDAEVLKNYGLTAEKLGSAVRQIGLALKQREGVKLIGIFDIIKILLTFRTLLNMVKSVGKSGDAASIAAVSGTLEGLGRVFRVIFKSFEVKDATVDSSALLAGRQRIELISTIFDKIKKFKNAKLPDLEGTFAGLTKLFSFLTKLKVDATKTEELKKYIGTILGELTRLNKIKVNKNVSEGLTALSKLLAGVSVSPQGGGLQGLDAISKLFENLKKVKLSKDELNNFKDFVKVLASGLKKLEKLTISSDVAVAINAIAASLKNLGSTSTETAFRDVNVSSVGLEAGSTFADSVEKGILQANLRLFLTRLFVDAIKVLNPVAIGGAIITGVTSAFRVIGELKAKFLDVFASVGNKIQEVGRNLQSFGGGLFNSLGLGAVANSNAFQLATDFDALSTQIQVFGNLTDEQTKKAQAFANEIGIKYPQSSNEALQGILNLQKAGLDLNQVFGALPAAADLASVSDTKSLDATSKALIQVTQSFQEFAPGIRSGYENASVAADILARSANLSTASVESLTAGLANVGPVANTFGLDLQETTAVLSIFEDNGIKGAEAGTQLKSMLTSLISGSKDTRNTLRQLGVSLTDSKGNFKDLNTIVNELNTAMNSTKTVTVGVANVTGAQKDRLDTATKAYAAAARQILIYQDGLSTSSLDQETANKKLAQLQQVQANAAKVISEITGSQGTTENITREITRTQAQNAAAIKKLAGSYGQAGLSVLINAGDDAIRNFIESTGRLPTAAEQASLLLDNLKGDAEQLRGSFETLLTRGLLPLIGRAFRPLVQLGRTVVDFFNSMPDAVFDVASNVILLVSGVASLISGLSIISGIALQFTGALISGAGVLLTMGLNMGLVVGAVAGLVASFATLIVVGGLIATVVTAAAAGVSYFFNIIESNAGYAGDAFNSFKDSIRGVLDVVGEILRTGGNIISFVVGDGLNDATVQRGQDIANFFWNISSSITSLKTKLGTIRDFANAFNTFLRGPDQNVADQLTAAGDALGRGSLLQAPKILSAFQKSYTDLLNTIGSSSLFNTMFGRSVSADEILGMFNTIKTGLYTIRTAVLNTVSGLSGVLLNALGISNNPQAKAQLTEGLSSFGTLLTQGLQKITGLDLSKTLLSFKAGDLSNGAKGLLSSLLDALKGAILSNEDGITNVLSTIFGFFVPGKSLVPLILDALGLNKLADAARGVFDTVDRVFRAGVGTIFDLMRGQTLEQALVGNFGSNIQSVIRAFQSLGNALGNIAGLFGDLFAALFPPGKGSADPGGFLASFFDGVASAVDIFNSAVVTPLRSALPAIIGLLQRVLSFVGGVAGGVFSYLSGIASPIFTLIQDFFSKDFDLSTLGTRLPNAILTAVGNVLTGLPGLLGSLFVSLGNLFGAPILNKIGEDLKTGDLTGAISTIATAVVDVVKRAVEAVPNLLIDIGTTLGAPLFTKLGEGLKTGDFTGLASTIADTIGNALRSVPNLLINLGSTFSAPLLTKIGQDLLNADPAAVVSDVISAVSNAIKTALGSIPTRLAELGAILQLDFLKDITIDPAKNEALKGVIDTITRFIQLPLDTLKSVSDNLTTLVTGVKGIFEGTNPQGAENLKQLGIALGVIGGAIALFNVGAVLTTVTSGLSGLLGVITGAGGAIIKFAGIGAVLLIVKNAVSSLADVFSGKSDLGTAIGDFFFNIGADAIKLFGIDKIFGIDLAQVKQTWNNMFIILRTVAERVLGGIGDFFRNIIDGIQVRMALLQAQINIASPDQATRTAAGATFALNDILGKGDISNSLQAIQGALETGMNASVVKAAARLNFAPIDAAFTANIDNLSTMAQPEFNGLIASLASADRLDEAIAQIPPGGLTPFINKLLTVDPAALQLLDPTQLTTVLQSSLANGSITLDLAKSLILTIPDTVMTPAQKEAFIKTLQNDLSGTGTTTGAAPAGTPTATVETTVDVAPKAVVSDENKSVFTAGLAETLAGDPITGDSTMAIPVDQPVAPQATLDANGITSPDTAQAMADNLVLVQEQIAATIPQINFLTLSSTILSGVMNALVNNTLTTTLSLMDRLRTSATTVALEVPVKLGVMALSFMTAGALAAAGLNPLITKLDTIKTKITDIANALGSLQNGGTNVGTGTVAVTPAGGRADGGSVFAGKLYEVAERGISELLQIGGRTYLIPGQNGTVVPPVAPPAISGRGGSSVVNNSSADNSIGNVTIVIQGGTNLSQDQLEKGVANGMREYQRSNPVNRRLLLAGKT